MRAGGLSPPRALLLGATLAAASAAGPALAATTASTSTWSSTTSTTTSFTVPPAPTSAQCFAKLGLNCYSPAQVQRAYGLSALYHRGFNGKGRTIVIVDPFGSPTIARDLSAFDQGTGLPNPPHLRIIQPAGPVPTFNPKDSGQVDKAGETTLDVEWSHAIAPGANILLVETPVPENVSGGGFPQMMGAENYVVSHKLGDVISQSFGLAEQNFGRSTIGRLRYPYVNADRHNISVLAATNDQGVTAQSPQGGTFYEHRIVDWPSSDPLVTAIGGTQLHLDPAGSRISPDTAWNDTFNGAVSMVIPGVPPPWPWASTGGVSAFFRRPAYQDMVRSIVGKQRGVPDISMSAAFSGGVLIFESFQGKPGWGPSGGTSEACPEFAGIVAIADQYAHKRLGLLNPYLYALEQKRAPGIVDVTQGNNSVAFPTPPNGAIFTLPGYSAKRGYDLVTGVGTLNAAKLVPELAALARPPSSRSKSSHSRAHSRSTHSPASPG